MLPAIDFGGAAERLFAATAIFERASVLASGGWSLSPSTKTILMIDVPIRMRSPSLRSALRTFSPLTNVPLVEPRSWIVTTSSSVVILACLRDTMSSTSTMSRSDERPMMISRLRAQRKFAALVFARDEAQRPLRRFPDRLLRRRRPCRVA